MWPLEADVRPKSDGVVWVAIDVSGAQGDAKFPCGVSARQGPYVQAEENSFVAPKINLRNTGTVRGQEILVA